jgi:predicted nucleic acid-binding protein
VRVVLDTNVLVSGLLSAKGPPGQLLGLWGEDARFTLVTAVAQLDEVLRVAEYPKIRRRVTPVLFGELVAQILVGYVATAPQARTTGISSHCVV